MARRCYSKEEQWVAQGCAAISMVFIGKKNFGVMPRKLPKASKVYGINKWPCWAATERAKFRVSASFGIEQFGHCKSFRRCREVLLYKSERHQAWNLCVHSLFKWYILLSSTSCCPHIVQYSKSSFKLLGCVDEASMNVPNLVLLFHPSWLKKRHKRVGIRRFPRCIDFLE